MTGSSETVVAIHQPNFIPWLGLYDKVFQADIFVILDHVQAPNATSWLNRNRILVNGEPHWFTIPRISAGRGYVAVDELEIDHSSRFPDQHLKILDQEYGRHPCFDEVFSHVEQIFTSRLKTFAEMNACFLDLIRTAIDLKARLVSSRALLASLPGLEELKSTEMLLAICRHLGAGKYISGKGGLDYMDSGIFDEEGIGLEFQDYQHPVYPQHRSSSFVPNLSVLDALFNVGFDGVGRLIHKSIV